MFSMARRFWAIVLAVALTTLTGPVTAQTPQQLNWCLGKDNPTLDQMISGCTAKIQSGKYSGLELAFTYNIRGDAYGKKGDYERALKDFDKALKLYPSNSDAGFIGVTRQRRGVVLFLTGKYKRAIADFDEAIPRDPLNAQLSFRLRGLAKKKIGDIAGGDADIARAAEIEMRGGMLPSAPAAPPASTPVQSVDLCSGKGNPNSAQRITACTAMIQSGKLAVLEAGAAHYNRGSVYYKDAKYNLAISDFDHAIWLFPASAATHIAFAYQARGMAYFGLFKHRQAIADFDQALQRIPNDAQLILLRGLAKMKSGDDAGSKADIARANQLVPGLWPAEPQRQPLAAGMLFNRAPALPESAPTATAEQVAQCLNREFSNSDLKISNCSAAIQAGKVLGDDLATALHHRGIAYSNKKDYDHAIADYDQGIRQNPINALLYNSRGMALYTKGQTDRAIADFDQAIRLDSNFANAFFYRGIAYNIKSQFDQAIADFDQAIRLNPSFARAFNARGFVYARKGDSDRAIADYGEAIRFNPNFADAFNSRGLAYENKGEREQAIADFDRAIQLVPNNARFYQNRGQSKLKKGDAAGGEADLARAKELQVAASPLSTTQPTAAIQPPTTTPPPPTTRFPAVAQSLSAVPTTAQPCFDNRVRDPVIKLRACTAAIDSGFGNLVLAHMFRGLIHHDKGELDRAIEDFDAAIRLNPKYGHAFFSRGNSYVFKGDWDRAIADFGQAIQLDPQNAMGYHAKAFAMRGTAYANKGDLDRAIADYDQAIRLNPNDSASLNHRGAAYSMKGEFDRALVDFNQSIRLNPKDSTAFNNRASAYRGKNQLDLAIADYTQAMRVNPNNPSPYTNRGAVYNLKGEYTRAIPDFDQAIKLYPGYAEAYYRRGLAYRNIGQVDRAIADFDQAIRLNPNDPLQFMSRGVAYQSKRDYDRAIADFDQSLRLNPNNYLALWSRGICYQEKGDIDRAIQDFDQTIRLNPNFPDSYNNRGFAYAKKGEIDRAIADFDRAIQLFPNFSAAFNNRGEAKLKKGDTAGGNADIARAKELQALQARQPGQSIQLPNDANRQVQAQPQVSESNPLLEALRWSGTPVRQVSIAGNSQCAEVLNVVLGKSASRVTPSAAERLVREKLHGSPLVSPRVGSLVVLTGEQNLGIIGILRGTDADGNPDVISGSDGDRVSETIYAKNKVLGYFAVSCRANADQPPVPIVNADPGVVNRLFDAIKSGNVDQVAKLLDSGLRVDVVNDHGYSPLAYLFSFGRCIGQCRGKPVDHFKMAELLIAHGADVNARVPKSINPSMVPIFVWAINTHDENVVKLFLKNGADPAVNNSFPLFAAAAWGNVNIVSLLMSKGAKATAYNEFGQTPLFQAQNAEVARMLIAAGADVNDVDQWGKTPLLNTKDAGVAKSLIVAGADVNAKDERGRTPLFFADNVAFAKVLIDAGANLNATNNAGINVLDWVSNPRNSLDCGIRICPEVNKKLIAYLKSRGAKPGR